MRGAGRHTEDLWLATRRPGRESNPRPVDRKSSALTTTPPNHCSLGPKFSKGRRYCVSASEQR